MCYFIRLTISILDVRELEFGAVWITSCVSRNAVRRKGVCPPLPFGTVLLFREGQTERNLSSSDMIVNEAGANRPRYVIYTAS